METKLEKELQHNWETGVRKYMKKYDVYTTRELVFLVNDLDGPSMLPMALLRRRLLKACDNKRMTFIKVRGLYYWRKL